MNNSTLFHQAHRMVRLTHQRNLTYRKQFGQWLIFLKTGITNVLGITKINQSVCYVPILKHDRTSKIVYEYPLTFAKQTKTYHSSGVYKQSIHLDKVIINFMLAVLQSPLAILAIIVLQFIIVFKMV